MAIPNPHTTSEQVKAELGLGTNWSSEDVKAAVGLGTNWSSEDLDGYSSVQISAPSGAVSALNFGTAIAGFTLRSDGNTLSSQSGSGIDSVSNDDWYEPITNNIGTQYQAKVTRTSGAVFSGPTLGVWHVLSSNRFWSLSSGAGFISGTASVQIREGTGPVLATGSVTLSAEGGNV